jgi:hypothetical protein
MRVVTALFCIACSTASAAEAPQAYCGQFSGSICFTLGDGDASTHKIVIDFTIDEIQLRNSAHVTIYQGIGLSEQEGVGKIEKVKAYDPPNGNVTVYAGSNKPNRYFDIHYKSVEGWGVVQIFGYLKDKKAAQALAQFISTMHFCKQNQLSVSCTSAAPFADAALFLPSLAE